MSFPHDGKVITIDHTYLPSWGFEGEVPEEKILVKYSKAQLNLTVEVIGFFSLEGNPLL
jgi:hypothetical protein